MRKEFGLTWDYHSNSVNKNLTKENTLTLFKEIEGQIE